MLDSFEILTTSGVVLWSRSYAPTSPSVINSLITNVFIEERTLPGAGIADDISAANNPPYKHDQHTLKWTTVKELGLIFVVSYRPASSSPRSQSLSITELAGCLPVTSTPIMD
jgi:signal recognition particle receptor subunit alpha